MGKKIVFTLFVLILISAQVFLIYALQHSGADDFRGVWRSFGTQQTDYSRFVFRTIEWWWVLPVVCLVLLALTLKRSTAFRVALTIVASLVGTVAVYGSVYSPAMMIRI